MVPFRMLPLNPREVATIVPPKGLQNFIRISKIYHTGICMYNTMGINVRGIKNPEKVFSDIEHKIRECFIKNGGSISHHHGVGKLRKDFMPETISSGSIDVIQGIKKSLYIHALHPLTSYIRLRLDGKKFKCKAMVNKTNCIKTLFQISTILPFSKSSCVADFDGLVSK